MYVTLKFFINSIQGLSNHSRVFIVDPDKRTVMVFYYHASIELVMVKDHQTNEKTNAVLSELANIVLPELSLPVNQLRYVSRR